MKREKKVMAYVSQEDKKNLAPAIKAVLKKYNVKASIAVRHHSTLVVNIKSSPLDIISAVNESQLERTPPPPPPLTPPTRFRK